MHMPPRLSRVLVHWAGVVAGSQRGSWQTFPSYPCTSTHERETFSAPPLSWAAPTMQQVSWAPIDSAAAGRPLSPKNAAGAMSAENGGAVQGSKPHSLRGSATEAVHEACPSGWSPSRRQAGVLSAHEPPTVHGGLRLLGSSGCAAERTAAAVVGVNPLQSGSL